MKKKVSTERVVAALESAACVVESGWCRNEVAVDAEGKACQARSRGAVRFCLVGGLMRATKNDGVRAAAVRAVHDVLPKKFQVDPQLLADDGVGDGTKLSNIEEAVVQFNDSRWRKRAEVVGRLRLAAAGLAP